MHVTKLYIHPVKSLGGISVPCCEVDRFGLHWDRRWMLIDDDNRFITQRQRPEMALIKARMEQDSVMLTGTDGTELIFSQRDFADGAVVAVEVWDDICQARLGNAAMHQWLSDQLGCNGRLVFMPEDSVRAVDANYAGQGHTVGFADGYPLLLTQQSSLDDLNRHMTIDIGMERFRPNVVVSGAEAWQEDQWRVVQIGSCIFDVVKPCSRCAIPTIDPADASKQPEVFRTLKEHRSRDGEVYFGQNLVPRGQGRLSVGDSVTILESQ